MSRAVKLLPAFLLLGFEMLPGQTRGWIRVNQVGYLPKSAKVAVLCSSGDSTFESFLVTDSSGRIILGPRRLESTGPFGPFAATYRIDFSDLEAEGTYRLVSGDVISPEVRISRRAYRGAADKLLYYMRQQRSGFNPFLKDACHTKDGIVVDSSVDSGRFVDVSGGWHDASDYLQYVTTSATATFSMLMAYRDHPGAFGDIFQANGLEGANGVPDVLDEARWGLEWLVKMFPGDGRMYNQIADDRDHLQWDLPTKDSSDYGWGPGGPRPVYLCSGSPQGLFEHKNRSTGIASTAGKFASALGAQVFHNLDADFSATMGRKAVAAYELGKSFPGVCQTAPCRSPYFYEEDNWTDDMELAAAELYALTAERNYLDDASHYAEQEPVTPWMGRDTARHYQYYPWHNNGHYELGKNVKAQTRSMMGDFYKRGIEAVSSRAENGFKVGVPFIWCSNDLMASFATQCLLYRQLTGDGQFSELEAAARDWLFGCNPWGVSMVIGVPEDGTYAKDPHSVIAKELHVELTGGLVDGPVYSTIYGRLKGVRLWEEDEYAEFNTGFIVYHDDVGDYSTNEPILDGTANLSYLLSALEVEGLR